MGFNLLSAMSVVQELPKLGERLWRQQRLRAQSRAKRKFAHALMLVGNGKRSPFLVRRLTAYEHRLLVVSAIELLRVMRGEAAARIVRLLRRYDGRELLGLWMQHSNPQLRALAAEGLGHMGDSHGCLVLGRALEDHENIVRVAAGESLIRLGVLTPAELAASIDVNDAPPARLWHMLDVMQANHPDPAKRVVTASQDGDVDFDGAVAVV